jgi:uncharacterized protein (DUF1499 family)
MRRFFLGLAALAVVLAVASVGWVRLAPDQPQQWHIDPTMAPDEAQPNAWRVAPAGVAGVDAVAPVFAVPAERLALALDEAALAEPGTERLAGRPEDLWTTYVQRSPWVGFPDYVSVRAVARDDGTSSLAIFSRSRYGRGDMGVNRARVERWLAALAPLEE